MTKGTKFYIVLLCSVNFYASQFGWIWNWLWIRSIRKVWGELSLISWIRGEYFEGV